MLVPYSSGSRKLKEKRSPPMTRLPSSISPSAVPRSVMCGAPFGVTSRVGSGKQSSLVGESSLSSKTRTALVMNLPRRVAENDPSSASSQGVLHVERAVVVER